jgi:hypothetical protein
MYELGKPEIPVPTMRALNKRWPDRPIEQKHRRIGIPEMLSPSQARFDPEVGRLPCTISYCGVFRDYED